MEIGLEVRLHPTVHAAVSALQAGDKLAWLSCFTAAAKLFDNGKRSDFRRFTRDNVGVLRFTVIERADADGCGVYGMLRMHDGKEVRAYFRFRLDSTAMCSRLDVNRIDGDQPVSLLSFALHVGWQAAGLHGMAPQA